MLDAENLAEKPPTAARTAALKGAPAHKLAVFENAERMAGERDKWIEKNAAYYRDDRRYLGFIIPEGARVLDLGCGTGSLLASLKPSRGVGVDFSPAMIERARVSFPDLEFVLGDIEHPRTIASIEGEFDYVILSDTIGSLEDIEETLRGLHPLCTASTRLVIAYFSPLWEPLINLGAKLGWRMPQPEVNLISSVDFLNIMDLTEFEPIRMEMRQLVPFDLLGVGRFINRYIAPLPGLRSLCLRTYLVARSLRAQTPAELSTTILIPCRNERGNIERAIQEMPRFGGHQEVIYVEGNSRDDTYEECLRVQKAYEGQWDASNPELRGMGVRERRKHPSRVGDSVERREQQNADRRLYKRDPVRSLHGVHLSVHVLVKAAAMGRTRPGSAFRRNHSYVDATPERRSIRGAQPRARIFSMLTSLRSVPSGFE